MKYIRIFGVSASILVSCTVSAFSAEPIQAACTLNMAAAPWMTMPSPSDQKVMERQDSGHYRSTAMIGSRMLGADHEPIGTLTDLVVDSSGRIVAMIVDLDSGSGVATKKVAVTLSSVSIASDDNDLTQLTIHVSKDILTAAAPFVFADHR